MLPQGSAFEAVERLAGARRVGLPGMQPEEVQDRIGAKELLEVCHYAQGLKKRDAADRVQQVMRMAVGVAILQLAPRLPEQAQCLWAIMDSDANGQVTKAEFLATFPRAVRYTVHEPLLKSS